MDDSRKQFLRLQRRCRTATRTILACIPEGVHGEQSRLSTRLSDANHLEWGRSGQSRFSCSSRRWACKPTTASAWRSYRQQSARTGLRLPQPSWRLVEERTWDESLHDRLASRRRHSVGQIRRLRWHQNRPHPQLVRRRASRCLGGHLRLLQSSSCSSSNRTPNLVWWLTVDRSWKALWSHRPVHALTAVRLVLRSELFLLIRNIVRGSREGILQKLYSKHIYKYIYIYIFIHIYTHLCIGSNWFNVHTYRYRFKLTWPQLHPVRYINMCCISARQTPWLSAAQDDYVYILRYAQTSLPIANTTETVFIHVFCFGVHIFYGNSQVAFRSPLFIHRLLVGRARHIRADILIPFS